MKYIIFEVTIGEELKKEEPVIFPNMFVHEDVAKRICHMLEMEHNFTSVPVSAGEFNPISCECSGKSETLNLKSRPQDSDIVKLCDYGMNFK